MWVGKNNLCAVGVLSATIEYNVLRIGLVRAFKGTSLKLRTKRSDEKLRPKRDIARIRLMRCWWLAISLVFIYHLFLLLFPLTP